MDHFVHDAPPVVPAQAGVILRKNGGKKEGKSCSRASGGDPDDRHIADGIVELFPRKRG